MSRCVGWQAGIWPILCKPCAALDMSRLISSLSAISVGGSPSARRPRGVSPYFHITSARLNMSKISPLFDACRGKHGACGLSIPSLAQLIEVISVDTEDTGLHVRRTVIDDEILAVTPVLKNLALDRVSVLGSIPLNWTAIHLIEQHCTILSFITALFPTTILTPVLEPKHIKRHGLRPVGDLDRARLVSSTASLIAKQNANPPA